MALGNLGPRKVEVLKELKFPNHDGPKQFFNSELQWNDGVVISSLRKKTDKLEELMHC